MIETLLETRREVSACAFLCKVSSNLKLSHFSRRPLCSANCLSSLRRSADFSPPYRFNCLWACSFHFSFHDLRLLRNKGVAQYAEHLIVINAVFAIVPFVPRLKIPSGVEVHQFGRLHVAFHKNEFAADNFPRCI